MPSSDKTFLRLDFHATYISGVSPYLVRRGNKRYFFIMNFGNSLHIAVVQIFFNVRFLLVLQTVTSTFIMVMAVFVCLIGLVKCWISYLVTCGLRLIVDVYKSLS